MPGYLANPGGFLQVPLMLDNAAGLAAIQVQVNFDPEVVELQSVSTGPLGQAFEMSQGDGDGFVQLTFFRGEALAGGSGRLAVLRFRANPGAVTDLFSELTIADLVLSDSTGVIDLRQKDTLDHDQRAGGRIHAAEHRQRRQRPARLVGGCSTGWIPS